MKKSLDKAGWTELCKNYNAEVVNRRAKNKALKDVLKYKTAHLLMLAHGRASEMMMAQHLLKRKLRKLHYRSRERGLKANLTAVMMAAQTVVVVRRGTVPNLRKKSYRSCASYLTGWGHRRHS